MPRRTIAYPSHQRYRRPGTLHLQRHRPSNRFCRRYEGALPIPMLTVRTVSEKTRVKHHPRANPEEGPGPSALSCRPILGKSRPWGTSMEQSHHGEGTGQRVRWGGIASGERVQRTTKKRRTRKKTGRWTLGNSYGRKTRLAVKTGGTEDRQAKIVYYNKSRRRVT